jgi:hypothetical protein
VLVLAAAGCDRGTAKSISPRPAPGTFSGPAETPSYRTIGAGTAGFQPPAAAVSGEFATSHDRMLAVLVELREQAAVDHPVLGQRKPQALREELKLPEMAVDPIRHAQVATELGQALLWRGDLEAGIEHLTLAYHIARDAGPAVPTKAKAAAAFQLGLAWLRFGELENCCANSNAESCLIPIAGRGLHTRRRGSETSIQYLTEALALAAPDSSEAINGRWLLNVAYQTLGRYPESVPAEHLVPPEVFQSDREFPRFSNIAPELAIGITNLAGGAILDDLDRDGQTDVFTSTWNINEAVHFWVNRGEGRFSERVEQAGLAGISGGLNLIDADYDNDGDIDVLVLRGGWMGVFGRHPLSLLQNNGDGTFSDVTFDAGLGEQFYPKQTAAWFDFDNDGDLDLFVGNETQDEALWAPCQLFQSNGDGTFTDIAAKAGVENGLFSKGVIAGDYDGDRFPDIYVSNLGHDNRLYHNNRDGTFTDVAPALGVVRPSVSFAVWFWDFDNDGALDLWVNSYPVHASAISALMGLPSDAERCCLYQGDGRGGFRDVAERMGLTTPHPVMGSNFGDLDNDGFLDVYLGTGDVGYERLIPNVMYHNRGGKTFADVTTAGGFGHLQKGHGVAFVDLDHDGDQDVFEEMGAVFLADQAANALYENPGFGRHWLNVELVGVRSNRSALGARIRADLVDEGARRSIYRWIGTGGSFGCNPLPQHLGLGSADRIEQLEVYWPATDRTQVVRDLPADQFIQIVEGQEGYATLQRVRCSLTGGGQPGR